MKYYAVIDNDYNVIGTGYTEEDALDQANSWQTEEWTESDYWRPEDVVEISEEGFNEVEINGTIDISEYII